MLAVGGELPADDAPWAYEMKWDGIRAIAHVTGRRGHAGRPDRPGFWALAIRNSGPGWRIGARQVMLDGEVVAFGGDGWPSFEVLQQRMNVSSPAQVRQLAAEVSVTYLAFDVLAVDGEWLLGQPVPNAGGSGSTDRARRGALADAARVHRGRAERISARSRASTPRRHHGETARIPL